MKTNNKIALAKLAYAAVHSARRVVGLEDRCVVVRRGIKFDLDLSQGIDLTVFLLGTFEATTTGALHRNVSPGSTVVDVGANIGVHTLAMAKRVGETGQVLAFEPTEYAFGRLSRNLELNPTLRKRVSAYQCFLGTSDASAVPASIYSSWPLGQATDLHPKHGGSLNSTTKAACRSLDSVVAEHGNPTVQLIKLDVDGYECDVLSGARGVMYRDRPVFVMELAPYVLNERGSSLRQLLSFFAPLGYKFYHERSGRALPDDVDRLSNWIADGESKNVIARIVHR